MERLERGSEVRFRKGRGARPPSVSPPKPLSARAAALPLALCRCQLVGEKVRPGTEGSRDGEECRAVRGLDDRRPEQRSVRGGPTDASRRMGRFRASKRPGKRRLLQWRKG